MLDYAGRTHQGLVRSHNEDCFGCAPEHGLWLVADGMGGYAGGRVAAETARDTVLKSFAASRNLPQALQDAHVAIQAAAHAGKGSPGMGCTLVALSIEEQDFTIAWVGDARAYLWDGELHQLSKDHSYVQTLVDKGVLRQQEAAHHPDRNIVTQALGASSPHGLEVGVLKGRLRPGDSLLLCSDGLNDEVEQEDIALLLGSGGSSEQRVDRLLQAALAAGGRDNVTALVVNVPASEDTTTPLLPATASRRTPWLAGALGALAGACAVFATLWWLNSH